MNFTEYIFEKSHNSCKTSIIDTHGKSITYLDLYKKICNLEIFSNEHKIDKNVKEKIIILDENSFFSLSCFYSIIKNGDICIPLSTDISELQLEHIIKICNIKTIFVGIKYRKIFNNINTEKINIFSEEDIENETNNISLQYNPPTTNNTDIALILFTSGSTELPKGVMLTHDNLISNTNSNIKFLNMTHKDRAELILPFYHCYGMSFFNMLLKVGGSIVINNRFMFPTTVINDINKHNCTCFHGVPSTYEILLRNTNFSKCHFSSLRFITQAGGTLPKVCLEELIQTFPSIDLFIIYGQTEATGSLTYINARLFKEKIDSIGKAVPDTTVKVVDENGYAIKKGEIGELIASGPNIMKGYLDDYRETTEVLKNEWLYTGDLATIDEDEYIYITSRKKNIIKSGGYRISLKEIENVIMEIKYISEVALISVEDDILGEAIKAFIVLTENNPPINEEYILDYCMSKLPIYKVPKHIEFVDCLPKNTVGKIITRHLKN